MKENVKRQVKKCFMNEAGYWRVNVLATMLAIPYILFFAVYCWSPFTMYDDIRGAREELIEVIGIDEQLMDLKEEEIQKSIGSLAEMSDLGKKLVENDSSLVGRKNNVQIIRLTTVAVILIGLIIVENVVFVFWNFIKKCKAIGKPFVIKGFVDPYDDISEFNIEKEIILDDDGSETKELEKPTIPEVETIPDEEEAVRKILEEVIGK